MREGSRGAVGISNGEGRVKEGRFPTPNGAQSPFARATEVAISAPCLL